MRISLVPSSTSSENQLQFLTSYLINDTIALDAGSIGFYRTPREQARVKHVLISHTHMDHVASLPIFLENIFNLSSPCVTIHGSEAVLETLQRDLFNNRLWPDFISLAPNGVRFLNLSTLRPGVPIELDGLKITPIPVDHVVPTLGFLIEDDKAAVLIPSDTGPTEEIWQRANQAANLKAVFLESCFPNSMAGLAEISKHLTPEKFFREVKKLKLPAALLAVHIKPLFRDQIVQELQSLGLKNLGIARMGFEYVL
ncbi:MAG: 3',5'-cyclic-nucleotide phosphodiesterase [Planctomycetes bacterium]|nr:3',5'-cyclic-nucleotide phosphodiesterase [Planctomycetota bacterium]